MGLQATTQGDTNEKVVAIIPECEYGVTPVVTGPLTRNSGNQKIGKATAAAIVGASSVAAAGGGYTWADGADQILIGEVIKFTEHSTLYTVTANAAVATGAATISFTPDLTAAVAQYERFEILTYRQVRMRSEDFESRLTYETSPEVTAGSDVNDLINTDNEGAGTLGMLMSYGSADELLESAMRGEWSTSDQDQKVTLGVDVTVTLTADASSRANAIVQLQLAGGSEWNTIFAAQVPATVPTGPLAGEVLSFKGFDNSGNNVYGECQSNASGATLALYNLGSWVAEGPTSGVTVERGQAVLNGMLDRSWTIARWEGDLLGGNYPIYSKFPAQSVRSVVFRLPEQGFITQDLAMFGRPDAPSRTNPTGTISAGELSTARCVPITTTTSMTAGNAVVQGSFAYSDGNGRAEFDVQTFELSIDANLRHRRGPGVKGPKNVGSGRVLATQRVTMFLSDSEGQRELTEAYANDTIIADVWFAWRENGQGYRLQFDEVKITSLRRTTPATDQDAIFEVGFQAMKKTGLIATAQLFRYPDAVNSGPETS